MTEESRFVVALMQIDNLLSLLKGNEYEQHLYSHLIAVKVELRRQLTNLKHSSKIEQ